MIKLEVERVTIDAVRKALRDKDSRTPEVIKKALNDTAKQGRKRLAKKAQEKYVMKTGRFNKAMTIKNATNRSMEAIIGATGRATELKDFKVSPAKVPTQQNRPDFIKAKGLKAKQMKALVKGNKKAFVVRFKNGHVTVAERVEEKRFPIKTLWSSSIPSMLGNEKTVFDTDEQLAIYDDLLDNIDRHIKKVLGVA